MALSRTASPTTHRLPATASTVHRGYFDPRFEPVLTVTSEDVGILRSYLGLSRLDAYAFMSIAADFTVTQVVDQRQGVHGRIDKRCFSRSTGIPA